ncbi:unnamed protein product [Withania somnifera]
MWAVRRAYSSFKKQVFMTGGTRVCYATSEISSQCLKGHNDGLKGSFSVISHRPFTFRGSQIASHGFLRVFIESRSFSSQAGTKSSGEENSSSDDGFHELESSTANEAIQDANKVDKSVYEHELSEEDIDGDDEEAPQELELSDTETEVSKRKSPRKRVSSALFNAIVAAPALSVSKIMDTWVEGNDVTRAEVAAAMFNLRKRHMYRRALQVILLFYIRSAI